MLDYKLHPSLPNLGLPTQALVLQQVDAAMVMPRHGFLRINCPLPVYI